MKHPDSIRTQALEIYVEQGPAVAAAETGVPYSTITCWASVEGLRYMSDEKTRDQLYRGAAMRANTAERLLVEANQLLDQLWQPTVEKKAVTVSDGGGCSHVEIVDIELDKPKFADQQKILTTAAIALDKAQLLAGEATEEMTPRMTPERAREALGDEAFATLIRMVKDRRSREFESGAVESAEVKSA